jgi:two-component system, cell cycle sensor histidine kinase and response regulator CckA
VPGIATKPLSLPAYRLLLVEDNRGDRDLMREQLSEIHDFDLTIDDASTLQAAMAMVAAQHYDSLVIDLNLPDSFGLDTLKAMRRACPDTPIVVLSGEGRRSLHAEVLRAGAQDFLNKNASGTELMARAMLYSLERHRSEAMRRHIEQSLTENHDGVVVTDEQGVVLFVNQAALTLLGRSADDFLGDDFGFSIHENQALEVEIVHATERRTAELRVVPYTWNHRPAFLATLRDVTERTRLAEQLRHAQKLEAVGQLAGGVAHDFNNILTVVLASAEIVLEEIDERHPSRRSIVDIQQAGRRAAALTRQLLTFARRHIHAPKVLDLNESVTSIHKMLDRLIGEHVQIVLNLDPSPPHVLVDPDQMSQVLTNLVVNARDAMPRGGTITIRTSSTLLDDAAGVFWGLAAGRYVVLSVRDTGEGMSRDVKDRAFEPFYTTKKEGRGTGLGLSMVHGIITQSGGQIKIDSEPNVGTTFTMLLPVAVGPLERTRQAKASLNALAGTERILLVEDESSVRTVASDILMKSGYRVTSVDSSTAALETWMTRDEPFDLVLTDVVMPGMTGWALGEQIQAHSPAQKIIYMSGYSHEVLAQHGAATSSFTLLQKPFTKLDLLRTVRYTLDRRS